MVIEQIKHQLDRMIPVYRVVDMTLTGRSIERELAMVKVRGGGDNRVEALRLADAFRARVIDATIESFVFEITGNSAKISQFIDLMRRSALSRCRARVLPRSGVGPRGCESCWRATGTIMSVGRSASIPRWLRSTTWITNRDSRARAALTMLGVQPGWRLADIGCGNGVLACEAAQLGAEVDAIDISPAMLALAKIQAGDRKVAIRTQSADC